MKDCTKVNTETSTKIILKEIAPNFHSIQFTKSNLDMYEATILYFSYETLVGFTKNGETYCIENNWGTTTGKHLNYIQNDKKKRFCADEFEKVQRELINIC